MWRSRTKSKTRRRTAPTAAAAAAATASAIAHRFDRVRKPHPDCRCPDAAAVGRPPTPATPVVHTPGRRRRRWRRQRRCVLLDHAVDHAVRRPCVARDANIGRQLVGGNSSWCPELESRTTHRRCSIRAPRRPASVGANAEATRTPSAAPAAPTAQAAGPAPPPMGCRVDAL